MDPAEIRAHKFSTARRGYERSEVDDFLTSVSDHVQELEDRLSGLEATMSQLGLTDPVDLLERRLDHFASELGQLGEIASLRPLENQNAHRT